jgi:hypothetical protein
MTAWWCVVVQPSPLEQLSLSGTSIWIKIVVGRVAIDFSRGNAHMQVGQCNGLTGLSKD